MSKEVSKAGEHYLLLDVNTHIVACHMGGIGSGTVLSQELYFLLLTLHFASAARRFGCKLLCNGDSNIRSIPPNIPVTYPAHISQCGILDFCQTE